jgi:F5/8 type C domain
MAPYALVMCGASTGLIWLIGRALRTSFERWLPIAAVLVLLVSVAVVQNKFSYLETKVSAVEIQSLRTALGRWLDSNGYLHQKLVLIVLPPHLSRPQRVEQYLRSGRTMAENAILASSANPISIPWMINALLRERTDHPIGKTVEIASCSFDRACAEEKLNEGDVVISLASGGAPVRVPENPFVINLSQLTSHPVHPAIELVKHTLPLITASSQLGKYGPKGLFFKSQPGWHAAAHPTYPQTLRIDFREAKVFHQIGLLPQDTLPQRMPKAMRIAASDDGDAWRPVADVDDACSLKSSDGWHILALAAPVRTRYLRIHILSNCGDPNFLTLRGLRVE